MSSLYTDPRQHPGTSAAVPSVGSLKTASPPEREIMDRLSRTDQALDDLKFALNALDDRLNSAMTPGSVEEAAALPPITAHTLIGKRVELQEAYVRMAACRIQEMMGRLEI